MKWKCKKELDWRKRFAFFPKKIGPYWIWLEFYDVTGWYFIDAYNSQKERKVRYPSDIK